jgi:hypothetical protein
MRKLTARTALSFLAAPALGVGLVVAAAVALFVFAAAPSVARGPEDPAATAVTEAYVAVQFTDGSSSVRIISSTAPISRVSALLLAGFAVENQGDAVCSINGDGCPVSDCWTCGSNNWWQGQWVSDAWDASAWPPPTLSNGDIVAFHNGSSWESPTVQGAAYKSSADGLEYLRPLQDSDTGRYGWPGGYWRNDTLETLLAVAAAGYDAGEWRREADSPSLVTAGIAAAQTSWRADGAGKLAMAMAAGGGCEPLSATDIMSHYDSATGEFSPNPGYHAWAIMGLRAISETIPAKAVQALKDMQNEDRGWPYLEAAGSDTNGTALALQALVAAGETILTPAVANGLVYLLAAQNDDGGFPWDPKSAFGTESDVNSTALAVQAILAVVEQGTPGTPVISIEDPIEYLLSMQLPSGAFEWQSGGGANESATRQAIPALLGRSFPLSVAVVEPCGGAFLPITTRQ